MPLQVLADYRPWDKRAAVHFVGLSPFLFPFVPHSCLRVIKGPGVLRPGPANTPKVVASFWSLRTLWSSTSSRLTSSSTTSVSSTTSLRISLPLPWLRAAFPPRSLPRSRKPSPRLYLSPPLRPPRPWPWLCMVQSQGQGIINGVFQSHPVRLASPALAALDLSSAPVKRSPSPSALASGAG